MPGGFAYGRLHQLMRRGVGHAPPPDHPGWEPKRSSGPGKGVVEQRRNLCT
jgi:hypothetical protein